MEGIKHRRGFSQCTNSISHDQNCIKSNLHGTKQLNFSCSDRGRYRDLRLFEPW